MTRLTGEFGIQYALCTQISILHGVLPKISWNFKDVWIYGRSGLKIQSRFFIQFSKNFSLIFHFLVLFFIEFWQNSMSPLTDYQGLWEVWPLKILLKILIYIQSKCNNFLVTLLKTSSKYIVGVLIYRSYWNCLLVTVFSLKVVGETEIEAQICEIQAKLWDAGKKF